MKAKKCTKCGIDKPANTEYFGRLKDGFQNWCKECKRENHLQNREERIKRSSENYRKFHPKEHTVALPPGMKLCSTCKCMKPATNEHFPKSRQYKDGLGYRCKECRRQAEYWNDPEAAQAKRKEYYEANKEKVLETTKRYKEANAEWYQEYSKEYYKKNQETIKTRTTEYYYSNREQLKGKFKEYRERNKDKIRVSKRKYYIPKPRKVKTKEELSTVKKIYNHKRKAIQRQLVSTLSKKDWEDSLKFFDYKDAYTGLPMEVISQDHVIPITKDGGYTKQNIIPCESRINTSKGNKDLEDWYLQQPFYSEERLLRIYKWIGFDHKTNTQQLSIL